MSLGDAYFVLGTGIERNIDKGKPHVGRKQFVSDVVTKYNCDEAHPVENSLVFVQDLALEDSHDILDDPVSCTCRISFVCLSMRLGQT